MAYPAAQVEEAERQPMAQRESVARAQTGERAAHWRHLVVVVVVAPRLLEPLARVMGAATVAQEPPHQSLEIPLFMPQAVAAEFLDQRQHLGRVVQELGETVGTAPSIPRREPLTLEVGEEAREIINYSELQAA